MLAVSGEVEKDTSNSYIRIATTLLPVLTAVVGGIWALYSYLDHNYQQSSNDFVLRTREIQKPFFEKQTSIYFELAQQIGILRVADPKSIAWENSRQRLLEIVKGTLMLVAPDPPMPDRVARLVLALDGIRKSPGAEAVASFEGVSDEMLSTLSREYQSALEFQARTPQTSAGNSN